MTEIRNLRIFGEPHNGKWIRLGGPAEVTFVVQAGSHAYEAVHASTELSKIGISSGIIFPLPPEGSLSRFRATFKRIRELQEQLHQLGESRNQDLTDVNEVVATTRVVCVFNDWGLPNELVRKSRNAGRPVVGWVEGFQDFRNSDLQRKILPYSMCNHVLGVTSADSQFFKSETFSHVGSQRLWDLRQEANRENFPRRYALVNLNFTYGYSGSQARSWYHAARKAVKGSGMKVAFTRHPADRNLYIGSPVNLPPSGQLLKCADVVVTRSGTMMLEALASKTPIIYFNPHQEKAAEYLLRTDVGIREVSTAEDLVETIKNYRLVKTTLASNLLFPNDNQPSKRVARELAQFL